MPDQPVIDPAIDTFDEAPEDRARRIEWIKYYVRENNCRRPSISADGKLQTGGLFTSRSQMPLNRRRRSARGRRCVNEWDE